MNKSTFYLFCFVGWLLIGPAFAGSNVSIIPAPGILNSKVNMLKAKGGCPADLGAYFGHIQKTLLRPLRKLNLQVPNRRNLEEYATKHFQELLKKNGLIDDAGVYDVDNPLFHQLLAQADAAVLKSQRIDYQLLIGMEMAPEIIEVDEENVEYSSSVSLKLFKVTHDGAAVNSCEVDFAAGEGLLYGESDVSNSRKRLLCLDAAGDAALQALQVLALLFKSPSECL